MDSDTLKQQGPPLLDQTQYPGLPEYQPGKQLEIISPFRPVPNPGAWKIVQLCAQKGKWDTISVEEMEAGGYPDGLSVLLNTVSVIAQTIDGQKYFVPQPYFFCLYLNDATYKWHQPATTQSKEQEKARWYKRLFQH